LPLSNFKSMAKIDSHVAAVLYAAQSDDEDALIAELEDSAVFDTFREQRIQQLHIELSRAKSQKKDGYGSYTEVKEEQSLMDLTTSCKYVVVHFAKDDFVRCGVMDKHLQVSHQCCRSIYADGCRNLLRNISMLGLSK
jgi:hypothetical protein